MICRRLLRRIRRPGAQHQRLCLRLLGGERGRVSRLCRRLEHVSNFFFVKNRIPLNPLSRILEYLIGTAAGAAALSACLDALYDGAIRRWSASIFGSSNSLLFGHVPDLLAAAITAAMTLLLAAGVRKSLLFNNLLNVVNFGAFSLVLLASLFYIDTSNWTAHGGFAPFGVTGVLNGAATCFYAFIGFDVIATSGEEAENAQRSIPTAIVSSMVIALAAYITSGLLVTLMVPYEAIDAESSLVEMFTYVGAERMKAVAAIGAMAGLVVSMFGSMVRTSF